MRPWNPYPSLPMGAVRDLLGITRAMYRLALSEEARDVVRIHALEEIGRTLRGVLGASGAAPGTIAYHNACAAAARAITALKELVAESHLAAMVDATARLIGARPGSMV